MIMTWTATQKVQLWPYVRRHGSYILTAKSADFDEDGRSKKQLHALRMPDYLSLQPDTSCG
jgi:hypothetical protein